MTQREARSGERERERDEDKDRQVKEIKKQTYRQRKDMKID